MEVQIKIAGTLLIALSLLHIGFPARFRWKEELTSLSLLNRQMMYVHTFFIGLVVLLMGVLCLSSAEEMVATPLGRKASAGLAGFWAVRLVFQFFVYSPLLWKGKRFETTMHVFFSLLWLYFTAVFWWVATG